MRKIFLIAMLLLASSAFAAQINWAKDFRAGLTQAKMQDKPMLFVFSRHTCKYCVLLEKTTFHDPKVIEALNKDFVSVVSYTDERDYTPRGLMTPGTPALWFLKPDGQPMFQPIMGAIDSVNFLKALSIVKKAYVDSKKGK